MSAPSFEPSTPDLARMKRRASPPTSPGFSLSGHGPHEYSTSGRQSSPRRAPSLLSALPRRALLRIVVFGVIIIPTLYIVFSLPIDVPDADVAARQTEVDGRRGNLERTAPRDGTTAGRAGKFDYAQGARDMARRMRDWGSEWRGAGKAVGRGGGAESGTGAQWVTSTSAIQSDTVRDLEEDLPLTEYEGGIAGYSVFSNLYLSSGSLLFVGDPETPASGAAAPDGASPLLATMPGTRQIMSGPKPPSGGYLAADEERWRVVDEHVAAGELGRRAVELRGVTYIFNDGPGNDGYLVYFRHFVLEAFLGASRVLASVLQRKGVLGETDATPTPSRVWFPRCGWKPSWRDDRGENAWFLAHALPGASIEDANGFADRSAVGLPVLLERAVIIDRWAAHSVGGEVGKWGKMNAGVLPLPAPRDFWRGIRENVMRTLGVDDGGAGAGAGRVGARGLPVVVYVDNQSNTPKLSDNAHARLIRSLTTLTPIAEVHVTRLSAMTRAQQVDLMGRAEVVISLHTDDVMAALWMPATGRSAVIELFEDGGFDRSFELLASALNHKYIAVQNGRVVSEEEWRELGSQRGENAKGQLEVDGELIVRLVRETLQGGTGAEVGEVDGEGEDELVGMS